MVDFSLNKIFVEGITDQKCIEKIFEIRYGITFPHDGIELNDAIINCVGWSNLKKQPALINPYRLANNGKNLVLFDADTKYNEGGLKKRYKEIEDIIMQVHPQIKYKIYLLPNNQEDGDLESFYCSCFKDNMSFFNACWDNMIHCITSSNAQNLTLKIPKSSEKVWSYVSLFENYKLDLNDKNTKGQRNYFDKGLWNFDFSNNKYLVSLTQFLETELELK